MEQKDKVLIDEIYRDIVAKEALVASRIGDKIPYTTDAEGHFDDKSSDRDINWWTNGFYGGMLWLMYKETHDFKYAQKAQRLADKLSVCFFNFYQLDHDMGFLWMPTDIADYRITGSETGRRRGIHAATILAGRFNPAGNFIRAWNDGIGREHSKGSNAGWCIIDCLMNLPLLYWASIESGDPRFKNVAMKHADMAINNFLRADGSVNHIVSINPETGKYVESFGGQGYGVGSSWTRGQAWALYGFVLSYLYTGEERYLLASKKVADYFIMNIPESGLIPIDFKQPEEPAYEDSTAAAIAACGLITLSEALKTSRVKENFAEKPENYEAAALRLIKALAENRLDLDDEHDNLLTHCSSAYHNGQQHISIIYGDYFFMEAIFKLHGSEFNIWK
ncbi:MAG: glycoside hydrolase family 88 protein [Lachnospiraceae bacterium]|nr:glycoside hydrolase family 88 protein [Lachnospiraceae bacterium]